MSAPMRHGVLAAGLALLLAASGRAQQTNLDAALGVPTPDMIRAHTGFLASDLLAGRAPGTPGARVAAAYIAAQFEAAGLTPGAADGGYYQHVPMIGLIPSPSLLIGIGRDVETLAYRDAFVAWPMAADSVVTADAEIVFVGYGIQASEWNWDDYKGQTLTGKILLMLVNDPGLTDASRFEGRTMTYYGRWTYKLEQAARMGAVGAILVHTDESATYPWSVVRNSWTGEQTMLAQPASTTMRFGAWITERAARQLAQATGRDFDALRRRAQQRDFRPITMGAHAVVHIRSQMRTFDAENVIARLNGADSVGQREAVVFTAHYDHLGIGQPVNGDSIDNGAEDNASGVATMLAAATALGSRKVRLRRSLVFIATTAEEAGLLGAEAYVSQPVVPLELTAAEINLDRANLRGPARDAVALGADRSDLGTYFAGAATAEGLSVASDPNPGAGHFFRSDHFPFARRGVPVLSLRTGSHFTDRPEDWGQEQERRYVAERYHQPSDEMRPDFDFRGAVQQARLLIRLAWALGSAGEFPQWKEGTEFRAAGDRLRARRLQYRR